MQMTEMRNPNTVHIDRVETSEMLKLMNNENKSVPIAIDEVIDDIARAVDVIADALMSGGRLIYIGAGTSGRLGVMDAAECPPTFGVSDDTVIGIIAGGARAMMSATENIEDRAELGREDIEAVNIRAEDVVVGISASGNAAYVVAAMLTARDAGAKTVALVCNKGTKMEVAADITIAPETGAEVIAGSTRLKAGTAQKLILNMLSTGAMIKTGKVYENYMINVRPVNSKLTMRCVRIVADITGSDITSAQAALNAAKGSILDAIEAIKRGS